MKHTFLLWSNHKSQIFLVPLFPRHKCPWLVELFQFGIMFYHKLFTLGLIHSKFTHCMFGSFVFSVVSSVSVLFKKCQSNILSLHSTSLTNYIKLEATETIWLPTGRFHNWEKKKQTIHQANFWEELRANLGIPHRTEKSCLLGETRAPAFNR